MLALIFKLNRWTESAMFFDGSGVGECGGDVARVADDSTRPHWARRGCSAPARVLMLMLMIV